MLLISIEIFSSTYLPDGDVRGALVDLLALQTEGSTLMLISSDIYFHLKI